MNIVVINSKGGVGKSTISIQIAATYIYQLTGKKVNHYEFDDENQDNISFKKSSIVNIHTQTVAKTDLKEKLADILLDKENIVIDIGAGKTTVYFLRGLLNSGMIYTIDLFIIPLSDGESDALGAIRIYKTIKDVNPNAKILFALNRVQSNRSVSSQFNIFLGDKRNIFNEKGIIEMLQENDRHFIQIEDSDTIKYSKNFGLTILELATNTRDIESELKKALDDNASKDVLKTLSFKKSIKDDCSAFVKSNLLAIFNKIKTVIN